MLSIGTNVKQKDAAFIVVAMHVVLFLFIILPFDISKLSRNILISRM